MNPITYTSTMATYIKIPPAGVLSVDSDAAGYPLSVVAASVTPLGGPDGEYGCDRRIHCVRRYTWHLHVHLQGAELQGTQSSSTATVTVIFPPGSGLTVTVVDGQTLAPLAGQDYRWIIEEDRTFYVDPKVCVESSASGLPRCERRDCANLWGQFRHQPHAFHSSGLHRTKVLRSRPDCSWVNRWSAIWAMVTAVRTPQETARRRFFPARSSRSDEALLYLGSAGRCGDPFTAGYAGAGCANGTPGAAAGAVCGHTMGGAPILFPQPNTKVTVLVQPGPLPPGKLSVAVFEDDFPLNGEWDAGGGVDVLATNEPGLGWFQPRACRSGWTLR